MVAHTREERAVSRIVIDARESGTSTGRYVDKLIEYLHKLEPSEEIILLTKAKRVQFLNEIAPKFVVVETPFKEFTFGEQLGLLRQIMALKPDLVHFAMVQQPVLYGGRVVTTMHDLTTTRFRNPAKNSVVFTIKQQVYKWVNRRAARKSRFVITPSQFVKDDVVHYAGIKPEKVIVTHESADAIPDTSQPVSGLEHTPFIMYVGRPTPHKNLPRLIKAFQQLRVTHPEIKLVLAGKKDVLYEQIEGAIQKEGVQDVIFTGFVDEGQLRWLYEHCAAYVFPSLSEGFGLPALEAMRHGAPVVSSNATCLPEVYGDAAHYFDPLDIQSMADAINEVLTDKDLRNLLIAKGKQQVGKYSWQRMAEQTLAVYREALSDK
jgi:glycosyltransferase involved in cell wall biosynthesis